MRRRFTQAYETACRWLCTACALLIALPAAAQTQPTDSLLNNATLDQVVQYALKHQPALNQAELDRKIIDKQIDGRLADWYPQINFVYNYQRNLILQQSV
ncbi:MAG TPA: TolC family protein, partial [Cyclobacteriaceae bacterium]